MSEEILHGCELISTTLTGDLRTRLFVAEHMIFIIDGDGLGHVVEQRARILITDYLELGSWSIDEMLSQAEQGLHSNYAYSVEGDDAQPNTLTDDIRIPTLRPSVIDNDIPF